MKSCLKGCASFIKFLRLNGLFTFWFYYSRLLIQSCEVWTQGWRKVWKSGGASSNAGGAFYSAKICGGVRPPPASAIPRTSFKNLNGIFPWTMGHVSKIFPRGSHEKIYLRRLFKSKCGPSRACVQAGSAYRNLVLYVSNEAKSH